MPAPGLHGDVAMVADLLAGLDLADLAVPAGSDVAVRSPLARSHAPPATPRRARRRAAARVQTWAQDRWAAGLPLDADAAVRAGLAGTTVDAALALTGWLVRALAAHAVRAGVPDVLAAGITASWPPEQREPQARWLLDRVRAAGGERHEDPRRGGDPEPVTAADVRVGSCGGRRGQHADARARALLPFTPTIAQETSELYVAAAIPPGSRRVRQEVWMAEVTSTLAGARIKSDAAQNVLAVAREMMVCADWATCTTRPGQERLGQAAGVCVRTVGRVLARLRAWGLLGGVVGGRSEAFARTAADRGRNRCAVYVLCAPLPSADTGPEGSVSPSPDQVRWSSHPSRTREEQPRAGPLRGAERADGAAARRRPGTSPGTRLELPRPVVPWPAHRVPESRAQRLEAALDLRWRLPVLRRMSTRDLASQVRVFHAAGWSVADLVKAIDRTPDGVARPHDGARGVRWARGWLVARLAAWLDVDGVPVPSPSQVAEASRAASAERARLRRQVPTMAGAPGRPSPGYLACKAALVEARAAARRRDGH